MRFELPIQFEIIGFIAVVQLKTSGIELIGCRAHSCGSLYQVNFGFGTLQMSFNINLPNFSSFGI